MLPPTGGRGRDDESVSERRQPCDGGTTNRSPLVLTPATGCAAKSRAAAASRLESPVVSAGATGACCAVGAALPKSFVRTANGFWSRDSVSDAVMPSRYGLNTAVSLVVLPWKSE